MRTLGNPVVRPRNLNHAFDAAVSMNGTAPATVGEEPARRKPLNVLMHLGRQESGEESSVRRPAKAGSVCGRPRRFVAA